MSKTRTYTGGARGHGDSHDNAIIVCRPFYGDTRIPSVSPKADPTFRLVLRLSRKAYGGEADIGLQRDEKGRCIVNQTF